MKKGLRKAVAFLMVVTMLAGASNVLAYASETSQTESMVTVLADTIYDEAVTLSNGVVFLQDGHWASEDVTEDTTIVFMDAEGDKTEIQNQDAAGDKLFDAIYPAVYMDYRWDALRVIKEGKISYIRVDSENPYFGDELQWYTYAELISNDYMAVSEDGLLYDIIAANGEVILEDIEYFYAELVGNCVYVKAGNAVHVIYGDNKVRNYNRFEDEVYYYNSLGDGYGIIAGGEYSVMLDKDGNIFKSFQVVGNEDATGVLTVDYVDVSTIETGYVVRAIEEAVYNWEYYEYEYSYYFDIYNLETGRVVLESERYPEFDGRTYIIYDEDANATIGSVDGRVYIENLDDYVYENLVTEDYEEAIYDCYFINGSLLISLLDTADMEEAETYVLTEENGFADAAKKHVNGMAQVISINEEYALTLDADGHINTMITIKGDVVKEYGNTDYMGASDAYKQYLYGASYREEEIEGVAFFTYIFDEEYDMEAIAYIREDGSIYEYTDMMWPTGNFLVVLDYNDQEEEIVKVINTDNEVVYEGKLAPAIIYSNTVAESCEEIITYWYADYFMALEEDRAYLYDRDGNKVFGDDKAYVSIGLNEGAGYYPAHEEDYYGEYEYIDEYCPNGICVTVVEDGDSYKFGAIRVDEKDTTPAKNGLHQDEATGKWLYYVNGVVDTTFDGVADNEYGTWYVENGQVDFSKNGLLQRGDWYYFKNGKVDTTFTGLTQNAYGWWYVENGKLEFDYTNLVNYKGAWWYVQNSQITFKYDGVVDYNGSTWYVEDSKVDFSKNGLLQRGDWYYFKGGAVDYNFTGLTNSAYGWWYIENGVLEFDYTDLVPYGGSWWYVQNSQITFKYDGVVDYNGSTWYIEDSKVDFSKNGLLQRGDWYYFKGGAVDYNFTGLTNSAYGWWYIENGKLEFDYTNLVQYAGSWWYVQNSNITFKYDGVVDYNGSTWYIEDSKVDFGKNGLLQRGDWYYFKGGAVDYNFTGLTNSAYGWWYIENGKLEFDYTDLVQYAGSWWYVQNSNITFKYDGVVDFNGSTWYIEDSKVDFSKNGLHQRGGTWYLFKGGAVNRIDSVETYAGSWWYVEDGVIDFTYNGIASNAFGTWYIANGRVDFGYNGTYEFEGETYRIVNGQATLVE